MKIIKRILALMVGIGLLLGSLVFRSNYLTNEADALTENIIEFETQRHLGLPQQQAQEAIRYLEH